DLPWNDRMSSFGMRPIARLAPGVNVEQASADLKRVGREVEAEAGMPNAMPELQTLNDFFLSSVRLQIVLLMGAVAFVLLIAAVTVANLLLARGEERRQEMAVRTALGAARSALVLQVLTESLVISMAGGLLGLALAAASLKLLLGLFGNVLPTIALAR